MFRRGETGFRRGETGRDMAIVAIPGITCDRIDPEGSVLRRWVAGLLATGLLVIGIVADWT